MRTRHGTLAAAGLILLGVCVASAASGESARDWNAAEVETTALLLASALGPDPIPSSSAAVEREGATPDVADVVVLARQDLEMLAAEVAAGQDREQTRPYFDRLRQRVTLLVSLRLSLEEAGLSRAEREAARALYDQLRSYYRTPR